jgi:hypothetical protein
MNANKQFLKECALYIKGEVSEIKIKGNSKTISLFAKTLSESRKFYVALQKGSLKRAVPLLESKRAASRALREKTGYVWPL